MTKEEARRAVLNEWQSWVKARNLKNPTGTDGLIFYGFPTRARPLTQLPSKGRQVAGCAWLA
jgi:hypothetical protein